MRFLSVFFFFHISIPFLFVAVRFFLGCIFIWIGCISTCTITLVECHFLDTKCSHHGHGESLQGMEGGKWSIVVSESQPMAPKTPPQLFQKVLDFS